MNKSIFLAISYTKRQKVENAITKFFENKGFDVKTGREIRSGKSLGEELIRIIKDCKFGVVVYNELRHNVSYEWGLLDALIDEDGHIFVFKDGNIHIDLDYEISDKKGITYTTFFGEDSEEDIIKSLEENEGLMNMIRVCIGETISKDVTIEVSNVASGILSSNVPMVKLKSESNEFKSKEQVNPKDLDDIKDLEYKFEQIQNLTTEGHFYKSSIHYYAGDYEKAEAEIRNVIEHDKNNSFAYGNLGVILSKLGKDHEAEEALQNALNLDPDIPDIRRNLGIIQSKLGKNNEAKTQFEELINLDPDKAIHYALLGSQLTKLGDYEEAEPVLRTAIKINSTIPMVHGSLGLLLVQKGDYKAAEKEFIEEIKLEPTDAGPYINLARLLIQLERYTEAEKQIDVALILDPHNPIVIGTYACYLAKTKEHKKAETKFLEALQLDSENIVVLIDYSDFLIKSKQFEEAIGCCRKIISIDQNNAIAHASLGFSLFKLGKNEEAEKMYNAAIRLDFNDLQTHINLGALLAQQRRYKEAEKQYLIVHDKDPDNTTLLMNLSELYLISSDYNKSYQIAEKGLKLNNKENDEIILNFLLFTNQILMGINPNKNEFIDFLEKNNGYNISFEFDTLKEALRKSEYYEDIEEIIEKIIEYSGDETISNSIEFNH